MAIFGAILLAIVTLMQLHVFWRAASVPLVRRAVPAGLLIAACAVLWLAFFIGRFLEHQDSGRAAAWMEIFGMDWLAIVFLNHFCLLVVDIITGFGLLFRSLAPRLRGIALAAGALLSLIAIVQGTRPPVVQNYEVRLPGYRGSPIVLVALSDLHLGNLLGEEWLAARVTQVEREHPDMIVLLGDLFEGHGRPAADMFAQLRRLRAPLGVWAVAGNHESYGRRPGSVDAIEQAGFQVLHNRSVQVRPGLVLAGVDYLNRHSDTAPMPDLLKMALTDRPAGATILLSHAPVKVRQAADSGIALMLAGHTHGGQIWPFSYLVRLEFPYLQGRYDINGMTLIVSRGTGTWGPRMRLWQPGQILRIRVVAS